MWLKRFVLIALLFVVTALAAVHVTTTEFEQLVWRFTNLEREKNNLPPLMYDDGLADLARMHCRNMLKYGFFDHKDQRGDYVNDRKKQYYPQLIISSIGENLARFYNEDAIFTPEEIVTGWMNSPEHRKNILNAKYTHLGVGVINNEGQFFAAQNFAAPLVKLITPIPKKVKKTAKLRLEFEYMSPIAPDKLMASLGFPNKSFQYQVARNYYSVGSQPVKLNWIDFRHLYVELDYVAGKGEYELSFGYGGGYYEEGVTIKVK